MSGLGLGMGWGWIELGWVGSAWPQPCNLENEKNNHGKKLGQTDGKGNQAQLRFILPTAQRCSVLLLLLLLRWRWRRLRVVELIVGESMNCFGSSRPFATKVE